MPQIAAGSIFIGISNLNYAPGNRTLYLAENPGAGKVALLVESEKDG